MISSSQCELCHLNRRRPAGTQPLSPAGGACLRDAIFMWSAPGHDSEPRITNQRTRRLSSRRRALLLLNESVDAEGIKPEPSRRLQRVFISRLVTVYALFRQ